MASMAAKVWTQMQRLLLPRQCVFCRQPAKSKTVCEECRASLQRPIEHQCQKCGAEVGPYSSTDGGCIHCRKFSLNFASVTCLGMYHDTMRHAILGAKFGFSAVGLTALADLLIEQHRESFEQLEADIILPMPQFLESRLHRAFNAADPIAERLGQLMKVPVDRHILRRRGRSKPQKRVRLAERFENQRDTFRLCEPQLVEGQTVLLVDDVMTTGATCKEAARLLKSAKAKEIHVAVLARVLSTPPRSESVT